MPTYEAMRSNAERIIDADIKERVLRGIEVLNNFDPEWPNYIDPSELLLQSGTQCVLGQVFDAHSLTDEQRAKIRKDGYNGVPDVAIPGYHKGLVILNGGVEDHPSAYGFDTYWESYDELTEAWLVALGEDD